jgi:hypothetical protein
MISRVGPSCFHYLSFVAASATCPSWLIPLPALVAAPATCPLWLLPLCPLWLLTPPAPRGCFRHLPLMAASATPIVDASATCPCGCFRYLPLVAASTSLPPTLLPLPSLHHGPHTRMLWTWKLGSWSSELSLKPGIIRPSPYHPKIWLLALTTSRLLLTYLTQYGFIGSIPPIANTYTTSNNPCVTEHAGAFSKILAREFEAGRYLGPLSQAKWNPLRTPFQMAPLSLIPKSGKPGCKPR